MTAFRALLASVLAIVALAACDPQPPAGTAVLHRVDVGGEALAGGWSGDTAWAPSPYATTDSHVITSYTAHAIDLGHGSVPAGTPAAVFQTQRVDGAEQPALRYDFPVPVGMVVQVRAYLAETRYTTAGQRVFDILIEDQLAFDDVDVFARSGGKDRGLVLWRQVTSDGTVSIELAHGAAGDPSLAGLEIVSTSPAGSPDIAVSPGAIHFTYTYEIKGVEVTNAAAPGSLPLVLQQPYLTGSGASAFVLHGAGATLAPGESTMLLVGMDHAPGTSPVAQLVIPSNDPDEPVITVALTA